MGVTVASGTNSQILTCQISGNATGVYVGTASGVTVGGCLIGLDRAGIDPLPNATGVEFHDTPGGRIVQSVVAGNYGSGVVVSGSSSEITVASNMIGLNLFYELTPNETDGIECTGGRADIYDNAIVGAALAGVELHGTAGQVRVYRNTIEDNGIGVLVHEQAAECVVGHQSAANRNVIDGNAYAGVAVQESALRTWVANNTISNSGAYGVLVSASNNTVESNEITGNGRDGVIVTSDPGRLYAESVLILSNSIHDNGDLGIRLDTDGLTGGNRLQPYPALSAVLGSEIGSRALGSLQADPNATYRIQFFANLLPDASGFGEGLVYLGETYVTTDAAGGANIDASLPPVPFDWAVSATATGDHGTSDFAQDVAITPSNPGPVLSSLSPASALKGSDGLTLTINGANFVPGATVQWNGADRTTTYLSDTQVTIDLTKDDLAAAGSNDVTVTNPAPGGGVSNKLTFSVNYAVPSVTALTPDTIAAGSPDRQVTITGANFEPVSVVRWNGSDRATTFVSATQLTVKIKAADLTAAGTNTFTVFTPGPGGGESNGVTLTVTNPVPVITQLNPDTISANGDAFTLTITGIGIALGCKARWNGIDHDATVQSSAQLTVVVPAADTAKAGSLSITLVNPGPGGGESTAALLTINNPPPAATALSPDNATVGDGPVTVSVNGTGFIADSVVRWNGADRPTTYISRTQVTFTLDKGDLTAAGTNKVTVFNPAPVGGESAALTFTVYNPAPVLTGLSPDHATAGGDAFSITVTGSGFLNGAKVLWNGSPRTTSFVSATQLNVAIGLQDIQDGGTASISVANPAPSRASNALPFTINNPTPAISALSPDHATAGSTGATVTITGSGFVPSSIARWNGADRTTIFVSPTMLTIYLTAADLASAGTDSITVFNPSPAGGESSPVPFTVRAAPPILIVASAVASRTNLGVAVTVTLKNLGGDATAVKVTRAKLAGITAQSFVPTLVGNIPAGATSRAVVLLFPSSIASGSQVFNMTCTGGGGAFSSSRLVKVP